MAEDHIEVGVVVARKRLNSPWAEHAWLPHAVLAAAAAADPWTSLGERAEGELFYAGALEVALHPAAAANYRDNLLSGRPSLWVALSAEGGERCEVTSVTADPYEGEALADGIGAVVEAVEMPPEIAARLAAFAAAFPLERPFLKRERDRADPDVLGHRPRVSGRRQQEGG